MGYSQGQTYVLKSKLNPKDVRYASYIGPDRDGNSLDFQSKTGALYIINPNNYSQIKKSFVDDF